MKLKIDKDNKQPYGSSKGSRKVVYPKPPPPANKEQPKTKTTKKVKHVAAAYKPVQPVPLTDLEYGRNPRLLLSCFVQMIYQYFEHSSFCFYSFFFLINTMQN